MIDHSNLVHACTCTVNRADGKSEPKSTRTAEKREKIVDMPQRRVVLVPSRQVCCVISLDVILRCTHMFIAHRYPFNDYIICTIFTRNRDPVARVYIIHVN